MIAPCNEVSQHPGCGPYQVAMVVTIRAAMRRRGLLLLSVIALVLLTGGPAARADDDGDDGGGGGGAGGGGNAGAGGGAAAGPGGDGAGTWSSGRQGLGPNPGQIPMPQSWQRSLDRLFGAAPAPPVAGRPAPPRADVVALGITPAALARLRAEGFAVVAQRAPAGLVRLRGPAGLPEAQALARLRTVAPGATADRNHRYRLAGEATSIVEAPPPAPSGCQPSADLVALVDTGVDASHPDLAGRIERQEVLRGPGRRRARTAHGTAVASRLAAAAPGLRIVVLDAFHLGPDGEVADAYDLAAAIARAGAIGAGIATVSVVGPDNAVVDRVGAGAAAGGTIFVAAAGNDGPRAAPLYPAAYGWTVAVTAVDTAGQPWPRAATGPHIAFAAHGVEVPLASGTAGRLRRWSGTSFAAPVVSAALALMPESGAERVGVLAAQARDAGPPGRDPVYGWGVVEPRHCAPTALVSGSDRPADR